MSLFPRVFASEFAPMFRLLDDCASHAATRGWPSQVLTTNFRTWQPKFDIKENKETYELFGELPGIEQKDLNIEFTDAQTLSIRGRSERVREEGTRQAAAVEGQDQQQEQINAAPAPAPAAEDSETSSNFHKASVEDEYVDVGGAASNTETTEAAATPTATEVSAQEHPQQQQQQQQVAQNQAPRKTSRYWLSERSIGEFQRRFEFPGRIDQDAVKASLKNGILSIVVPKAAAPVNKHITVE